MNNSPMFGTNPYYPTPYSPVMPSSISYPQNNLRSVIPGRSVASVEEIVPGEVPMDGGLAIFPKSDGSAIYVKSFNGDMSMNTKTYIPAPDDYNEKQNEESAIQVSNVDILNSISDLTDQISNMQDLVKNLNKHNSYNKPKNQNRNNRQNNQNEGDEVNA